MTESNCKHILSNGWIRNDRLVWRECSECRQAFISYGRKLEPTVSDYQYYKRMADYYGV